MRPPRALAWARSSLVLPLVVGAAAYGVLGYNVGHPVGFAGDPSVFIHPGKPYLAPDLLPSGSFVEPVGSGYDGQFFFYMAQDPLLNGDAARRDQTTSPHIDNVPYRYQRILLPLAGWVTSWGDPDVLVWTMPLINLLSVLGAGYLLARFLARRGHSPWLSLVYVLSLGVVVGVVNDLSDPLAASLFVAGVVWWIERRSTAAVVALALCLLAREVYLIPVAIICISELYRGGARAAKWVAPLGVWAAWQVYLRAALAASPTQTTHGPSPVPLLGTARKVKELLRTDLIGSANWELLFMATLLLTWVFFAVHSLQAADRVRHAGGRLGPREQLLPIVALGAILLIPFLTVALWRYVPSYSRYSAPAAGLLVLAYAVRPGRAALGLMVAVVALSLANPIISLLPTRNAGKVIAAWVQPGGGA